MIKKYMRCTDGDREAGFTLVELAVVMIIIGLLIGGVLKGQELIANAQVAATVAQVKAFDAATTTFRDMFDSMPGDMLNANTRLPNCNAGTGCVVAAAAGLGNRRVDGAAADPFAGGPSAEMVAFWWQMNAADLVSGIDPTRPGLGWGAQFPAAKIGGGWSAGYFAGNATMTNQVGGAAPNVRAGHYLGLYNSLDAAGNPAAMDNAGFITPNQAFRIDSKLDDGVPSSGSVMAAGNAQCVLAGPPVSYQESIASSSCNLFVRFQN